MHAATLHGPRDLRWERVDDPTIESPTDVVVRVELAAVCGSDLHPYLGRETGFDAGTIPGHEFVGTVVACGSEVGALTEGDRVHVPFTSSCGACGPCQRGLTARCLQGQLFGWRQQGRGLHGGQAELVRVPMADATAVRLPEGVDDVGALLLGDVLSTGWHGARQAEIGSGSRVAVVGCGPVGLMAVIAARELGAEAVWAIDPVAERRDLAEQFGAVSLASTEAAELLEGSLRAVAGEAPGVDCVVEAVGSEASTRLAFDLLRPGGVLSSVGVHTRPEFGFTPVEAYDKNLTLRAGRCSARSLMEELVPVVRRRSFEPLITHRLALADVAEGYRMLAERSHGCAKIVLDPELEASATGESEA